MLLDVFTYTQPYSTPLLELHCFRIVDLILDGTLHEAIHSKTLILGSCNRIGSIRSLRNDVDAQLFQPN